jgi:predicted nucleic acid-binding protein
MTTLLVDTSVILKWFHAEGETELAEARALRDATVSGDVDARVIDLALFEIGNVLLRRLRWRDVDVADQLDDVVTVCGPPLAMSAEWFRLAAALGFEHRLTFYDAAWAAAARALRIPLVSTDTQLVGAGLAESPSDVVRRLRLPL